MVNNYKCQRCVNKSICKIKGKLDKFSDEAKEDLGVALTFVACGRFEDDGTEFDGEDEDEDNSNTYDSYDYKESEDEDKEE